jgi:hypothetical protein
MIAAYIDRIKRATTRLRQINQESGKGNLRILKDYYSLHRKIQISLFEYFKFEFEKQPEKFRSTFLSSQNKRKFLEILNPRKYYILARNKYITHLFLESAGITKPVLYCYYDPLCRIENSSIGNDYNSILNILKVKNINMCIIKPTESTHGKGVLLIKSIDYKNNSCHLYNFNGEVIELSDLLKNESLIFESVIEQTEQFKKFNSSSVNTIRFLTILLPSGEAKVISTVLKIGRQGSCIDNARNGGNVDAEVEFETGKIHSAIQFNGWRQISPITNHPDTGTLLEGVIIENWHDIKNRVLQFQQAMPFLKAIGWDIAITDKGPVVIEINDFWDETGQLFLGKGWKQEIESGHNEWINYSKSLVND